MSTVAPAASIRRGRRRALPALAAATAIGASGLAAGGTAGALLAGDMISPAAAGLPLAFLVAGSAVGALALSRQTARHGRARPLAVGYAVGALGSALVIASAAAGSPAALLAGSALLGAANSALFLTRYAAAELGGDGLRGRALGTVLFATALGATASPNLLGPSGDVAAALGLPPLAGLYLVAFAAYAVAAAILALPAVTAAEPERPRGPQRVDRHALAGAIRLPAVRAAVVLLAATNVGMVAVMAVVPVHLMDHGETGAAIGLVVSLHVAAMFAPSPVTGRLADSAGPSTVARLGVAVLVAVGAAGAVTAHHDGGLATTTVMLVALGLGWNCGVVGASTLLAASAPPRLRPHLEGIGEATMGVAAAIGAPLAGVALATAGLPVVWMAVGALAVAAAGADRAGNRSASVN